MRLRSFLVVLVVAACTASVLAQQTPPPYQPELGQKGKDVQWVPTPPALVEKMLDMAAVTPKDYLVDLGSGDGVLVIAAAKRGIRAMGIEYDGRLVDLSKRNAAAAGVTPLVKFVRGDIFKTDFSKATVVTTFLLPSLNLQLRPTLLAMKPGTRIVSNTFPIGEWEPDETATIDGPCERWCEALFWIVPARVGGTWRTPRGDLTLTQKFQTFTGTLGREPVEEGRLKGGELTFKVGDVAYTGRVEDFRITVKSVVDGEAVEWTAIRR